MPDGNAGNVDICGYKSKSHSGLFRSFSSLGFGTTACKPPNARLWSLLFSCNNVSVLEGSSNMLNARCDTDTERLQARDRVDEGEILLEAYLWKIRAHQSSLAAQVVAVEEGACLTELLPSSCPYLSSYYPREEEAARAGLLSRRGHPPAWVLALATCALLLSNLAR